MKKKRIFTVPLVCRHTKNKGFKLQYHTNGKNFEIRTKNYDTFIGSDSFSRLFAQEKQLYESKLSCRHCRV